MSNESAAGIHRPQRPGEGRADLSGLVFLRIPTLQRLPAVWAASQLALWGLIRRHRRNLKSCRAIAADIRGHLEALFPLLDAVCRHTCPWCPDPCCIVATVWYDFSDLLFLHLIGAPLPPAPLADRLDDPCRYISSRGCRLPRLIRPWGCTQYTCATQRRNLHRSSAANEDRLHRTLEVIRERRYGLEQEFRQAVAG